MIIVNSVKSLAVKGLNLQEQKVLKEFQSFSFAAKMTCKKLCNEWRLFQTLYFLSWLDRKLLIIMNKLADRGTPTVLVYCLNKSEMHTGWTSMGRVCEGFANFWRELGIVKIFVECTSFPGPKSFYETQYLYFFLIYDFSNDLLKVNIKT